MIELNSMAFMVGPGEWSVPGTRYDTACGGGSPLRAGVSIPKLPNAS
jgi:hypothetical protein